MTESDKPKAEESADSPRMSFLEHLEELRWAIIRSLGVISVGFVLSLVYARKLFDLLEWPLRKAGLAVADAPVQLRTLSVAESFTSVLTLAALAGAAIAVPYLLLEIWWFISPGLKPNERRAIGPVVLFGTLFFFAGAAFTHVVVLPPALNYFLELNREFGFSPEWRIMDYLKFTMSMLFVSGILAELPVVTVILARFGIVSAPFLIHYWRQAVVIMLFAAAILTPSTDAMTMMLLAGPLIFLYGLSIGLAKIFYVQRW